MAVAILAISLTSLLTSQMNALRATRYAQTITAVSFLAESKLIDIEFELKQDGWGDSDKEFEGDFSEEGWPDVSYTCLVDMIEMPDYSELQQAHDAENADGGGVGNTNVQDTGEQAFDMLGMVWPIVKGAIENSIRKVSCTVFWSDGKVHHDFEVATFWTDTTRLLSIPEAGGEVGEDDDTDQPDPGGSQPGGGGRPGGGGGGKPGGGGSSTKPTVGPGGPPGGRSRLQ